MSVLSNEKAGLKAALLALILMTAGFSGRPAIAVPDETLNGRWLLRIETDQRMQEQPIDLRIEASGSARLVLLGPVAGEAGLFRGAYVNGRMELSGRLDGHDAKLTLSTLTGTMIGELESDLYRASLSAIRIPSFKPELKIKEYPKIFEGVWKGVQDNFYDPALKGVDWNEVRAKYYPIVRAARNDGELALSLRRMLMELNSPAADFHLATGSSANRLKIDRVGWKELSDKAGYLAIRSFSPDDLYSFDSNLDKAMDAISGKRYIVVDLRGNRGESLEAALGALNIMLPQASSIAFFVTREGLAGLGVRSIEQVDPAALPAAFIDNPAAISQFKGAGMYLAGGKYKRPYAGRYLVLIDELCTGSCELFAEAMREAGGAELIGRPTRGSLSVVTNVTFTFVQWFRVIKNDVPGWKMTLPMMDIMTAGKKRIESVRPDLPVERINGADADLSAALKRTENPD